MFRDFLVYRLGKYIDDITMIQIKFFRKFGRLCDFKNPKTFNEKLQWLKLNDRESWYSKMVDKYEVKKLVANKIGIDYVIPTLGIWDKFEDIDFDNLPNQFVLKCTHDSGGVVICKDKRTFDYKKANKKLNKSLRRNYFYDTREWPYKNVKPRIIAEMYMKDNENEVLPVYKIMCFNGVPRIIQTIKNDKQVNESIDYFDINWCKLDLRQNFPNSDKVLNKPRNLTNMLDIAKILSKDMCFIRVDLYEINGQVKFSEYTFYSDAGLAKFIPEQWDFILGEWIDLSIVK